MRAVKEQMQNQSAAQTKLRRLTASMNDREFNHELPATVEAEGPFSISFTLSLLNYCFGNAGEAATLRAMQIEDPAVLTGFTSRLERAAVKAGMVEAELAELQSTLSQSEGSAT